MSQPLRDWIETHVDPKARLKREPLFVNPRSGNPWAHKALQDVWNRAVKAAGLPPISLYNGTKHTSATDAIRRGVPERHLQRFLGHASIEATRRYARLAGNAMLEVLPNPAAEADWRQSGDKGSENEPEQKRDIGGGPSWTRTRDRPVMSRLL